MFEPPSARSLILKDSLQKELYDICNTSYFTPALTTLPQSPTSNRRISTNANLYRSYQAVVILSEHWIQSVKPAKESALRQQHSEIANDLSFVEGSSTEFVMLSGVRRVRVHNVHD